MQGIDSLRRSRWRYLWPFALIPLTGCQWIQDWWDPPSDTPVFGVEDRVEYSVTFLGDIPTPLEKDLHKVSFLESLQSRKPLMSVMALERRAEAEQENLQEFLKNNGYLEAKVNCTLEGEQSPYAVTVTLTAGHRYHIDHFEVHNTRSSFPVQVADITSKVKPGDLLEASKILALQKELTLYLAELGYPNAHVEEPWAEENQLLKSVVIHIEFDPGQKTRFGDHKVIGLRNLSADYIEHRVRWERGEVYNQSAVKKTRQKLMDSGIFDSVMIQTKSPELSPTPMEIQVVEAPPRTVGMGLRYFSSEGLGTKLFWRHHNLCGGGEFVNASLKISSLLKQIRLAVTLPDVGASEQQLINFISFSDEKTKAYRSKTIEVGAKLQRPLTDTITGAVGLLYEGGHVTRDNVKIHERLWGVPVEFTLDTTENALDPVYGWRLDYHLIPYVGHIGAEKQMLINNFRGSCYFPFGDSANPFVLANWVHVGSLVMKNFDNVPPNKRFYAGGGSSVRAYGFQRLGPFGKDGLPLGGRSLVSGGVEGRFRVTETVGAVLFAEGGAVSINRLPLTDMKFLWGFGAGIRYYTAIGPIRFDVAIPSHRRKIQGRNVDSPFQFFITIGQAF